jgi:hypothetical protein
MLQKEDVIVDNRSGRRNEKVSARMKQRTRTRERYEKGAYYFEIRAAAAEQHEHHDLVLLSLPAAARNNAH